MFVPQLLCNCYGIKYILFLKDDIYFFNFLLSLHIFLFLFNYKYHHVRQILEVYKNIHSYFLSGFISFPHNHQACLKKEENEH